MMLNKEQINRLYDEFDFDESEEIIWADYKGQNEFVIHLYDKEDMCDWDYKPSELEEDKTNYILEGKEK